MWCKSKCVALQNKNKCKFASSVAQHSLDCKCFSHKIIRPRKQLHWHETYIKQVTPFQTSYFVHFRKGEKYRYLFSSFRLFQATKTYPQTKWKYLSNAFSSWENLKLKLFWTSVDRMCHSIDKRSSKMRSGRKHRKRKKRKSEKNEWKKIVCFSYNNCVNTKLT